MNEFFTNRYVRLSMLTIGIAVLIYMLLYLIFMLLELALPNALQIMVSVLAAGYLVYKYFSQRIG